MVDDIDAVFAKIGFGRWQLIHLTAALLGPAVLAPSLMGSTLTNAPVPYRCHVTDQSTYGTTDDFNNRCDQSSVTIVAENNMTMVISGSSNTSCSSWEYDTSVFTSTISMEWGLICGDAWLSPLYQLVFSAGCMLGNVVGGIISDRLGRCMSVRYGSPVVVGAVIGIGLSPLYSLVLFCRLLLGLGLFCIIYPSNTLVMEITPTSQRTIVGMILPVMYSMAVMIFTGLGYFLRDWRKLHLASSIFAFLLLPVSWFLDESPRWLVQKGYIQEAKDVLQKAAAYNRSTLLPAADLDQLMLKISKKSEACSMETKKSSMKGQWLVFSKRPMAIIALIRPLTWFLMGVVYLGIPLNVGNFGSDPFIYLALTGVMEMLPTIIGVVFSKRFSRVPVMSFTFFVAGICNLFVLVVTEEMWWLKWILVMVAMEMISTTYMISYFCDPELYPTVIRSRGCCSCVLAGHLGFSVTPFITEFLAQRIWWLPNVIFGICSILGGILVLFLPETKGLNLCETVQDVEDRWRASKTKQVSEAYDLDHHPSDFKVTDSSSENVKVDGRKNDENSFDW